MFSDVELRDIVKSQIELDENLGEQVGGSGHLGYVSYEIDEIGEPRKVEMEGGAGWEIAYYYTIIVTTEFTVYPNNPPTEYKYKKKLIVDDKGNILGSSERARAKSSRGRV